MENLHLTITGVQYARSDYKEVLAGMKGTNAIMNIVAEDSALYGQMFLCFYKNKMLGKVSRLDVPRAQQAMESTGCKVMRCDLVDVYPERGFLTAQVQVDAELPVVSSAPNTDWDEWQWDGPVMDKTRGEKDAEAHIALLEYYLTRKLPKKAGEHANFIHTTIDAIGKVVSSIRFSVSWESQQACLRIRDLVAAHEVEEVRAMLPDLQQAINDLGSASRIEEFQMNEWPTIRNSEEADAMQQLWMKEYGVTSDLNEANYNILQQWLESTEHLLTVSVVKDLSLEMGDQGHLFHLLIYRSIPMEKWLQLRSFMILRHRIEGLARLYEIQQAQPQAAEPAPVYEVQSTKPEPVADSLREVMSEYIKRKEWLDDAVYNLRHASNDHEVAQLVCKMNKDGRINLVRKKGVLWSALKKEGLYKLSKSSWFESLS